MCSESSEDFLKSSGFYPQEETLNLGRFGSRHVLVLLGFLGLMTSNSLRVNLHFSMVSMVGDKPLFHLLSLQQTNSNTSNATTVDTAICPNSNSNAEVEQDPIPLMADEFDWDVGDQSIIFSMYSGGMVFGFIPGGFLADRFGGKAPFGFGILAMALLALLTPLAAWSGKGFLMVIRFLQGFAQGTSIPSIHCLLSKWLPPLERSKLGAITYSGNRLGAGITFPLYGLLISSGFLGGWPTTFYIPGLLGIVWFVFWQIFVFNEPAKHPRINESEKTYIQNTIGLQSSPIFVPIPWEKIAKSLPVAAITIAQIGQDWGWNTISTELPTYMKNVLNFGPADSGWLSSLPYILMTAATLVAGFCADALRRNKIASTTLVRKICNTIAHWIPAAALIAVSIAGCDRISNLILLNIAIGFNGFLYAGYQINYVDISPNHVGILVGFGKTISQLGEFLQPYTFALLMRDGGNLNDWRWVFLTTALIFFVDNLFYICFASGEEQIWNRDGYDIDILKKSNPNEFDRLIEEPSRQKS